MLLPQPFENLERHHRELRPYRAIANETITCKSRGLIRRTESVPGSQPVTARIVIHPTAEIIGEADSLLSRTRASLAPVQPVLYILDNSDPLAKLAADR
jgi:hypothetical protein